MQGIVDPAACTLQPIQVSIVHLESYRTSNVFKSNRPLSIHWQHNDQHQCEKGTCWVDSNESSIKIQAVSTKANSNSKSIPGAVWYQHWCHWDRHPWPWQSPDDPCGRGRLAWRRYRYRQRLRKPCQRRPCRNWSRCVRCSASRWQGWWPCRDRTRWRRSRRRRDRQPRRPWSCSPPHYRSNVRQGYTISRDEGQW